MKRQRNKDIILLIVVFILIVKVNKALAESATGTEDLIRRGEIEYKARDFKDPFMPPKKEKKVEVKVEIPQEEVAPLPLPDLKIQGLIWGGKLAQVIINNKVLKIGDTIEGVRIVNINKDGVIVSFENREYSLSSPAVTNLESLKESGGAGYEK